MASLSGVENLDLVGGVVCLDFANTVHNYGATPLRDELVAFEDLVTWSVRAGVTTPERAKEIRRLARRHPRKAARVLSRAKQVRAAIFAVFSASATGRAADPQHLETLNRDWAEAAASASRIECCEGEYERKWGQGKVTLEEMLGPVLHSALELLMSPDVDRLGLCSADGCTWLFLDRSRNRSRRWCEMETCGNRDKARRHYHRHRGTG